MNQVVGLAILAVLIKVVEVGRNLVQIRGDQRVLSVRDAYEIMNVHSTLSLALYGFIIDSNLPATTQVYFICAILFGAISKGVISANNPTRLRLTDFDSFFGVYLPNAISGVLFVYTLQH